MTRLARIIFPAALYGTTILGIVDFTWRMATSYGAYGVRELALGCALNATLHAGAAVVIGALMTALVLVTALLTTQTRKELAAGRSADACRRIFDVVFGRRPNWLLTAFFFVAYALGVPAVSTLYESLTASAFVQLGRDLGPAVALFAPLFFAFGICRIIAYRRGEGVHRGAVIFGITGLACYLVERYLTFFLPHGMAWAYLLVGGLASSLVLSRLIRRDRRWRVHGVVTSFAMLAGLLTVAAYPQKSGTHSMLMLEPVLSYPAAQVLALPGDLDGDSYSNLVFGHDCASLDGERHIGAIEIPSNGIDDNCVGGDGAAVEHSDRVSMPSLPPMRHSNVVIVSIDTLRADHVGMRVDGKSLTPNLDAFSQFAFTFDRAYSTATSTEDAVPAAMTGEYPSSFHQQGTWFGLEETLPEVLGQVGYESFAVVALSGLTGAAILGWDEVDNEAGYQADRRVTSHEVTRRAVERFQKASKEGSPFVMWVHYFDPHAEYIGDAALIDWLGERAYLHEVHRVDAAFGALMSHLIESGVFSDTVVVVFSDHGEALGEHRIRTHVWGGFESITRVPFMISGPRIPAGNHGEPVSTIDLFPTVLDTLGVSGVTGRSGVSLMPAMIGHSDFERGPVYIDANQDGRPVVRGIVDGDWKLLYDWRRSAWYLYDLDADPSERSNLVGENGVRFGALRERLWSWWDSTYNLDVIERKARQWEKGTSRRPKHYSGPAYLEFSGPDR